MSQENEIESPFDIFYMKVYYAAMNGEQSDTPLATKVLAVLKAIEAKKDPNLFLQEAFEQYKWNYDDEVIKFIVNNYTQFPEITINVVNQALVYAAKSDNLPLVQYLIDERGANNVQDALKYAVINVASSQGIHSSSYEREIALVRYLIDECGADPLASVDGETAVAGLVRGFNAITGSIVYSDQTHPIPSLELVRDGYKSAHENAAYKAFEILYLVRSILDQMPAEGAREACTALLNIAVQNAPEALNQISVIPLRHPVNEFFNMVDLLLEFGGDVNATPVSIGPTTLQSAIMYGGRQMVAHLLEKGANLDQGGMVGGLYEQTAYEMAIKGRADIKYVALKKHLETYPDDHDAKVGLTKTTQALLEMYQVKGERFLKPDDQSSLLVNVELPDSIDELLVLADAFLDVEAGTSPIFCKSVSEREIAFVGELIGHIEASTHPVE